MRPSLPTTWPRWPASRAGGLVLSALAYSALTLALAPFFDEEETLNVSFIYLLRTVPLVTDSSGAKRTVKVLRVRTLGQSELNRVVPNGHLAGILLQRAHQVTPQDTLISMAGAEGSYLLETMTNFVCDRVSNGQFPHDVRFRDGRSATPVRETKSAVRGSSVDRAQQPLRRHRRRPTLPHRRGAAQPQREPADGV